MKIKENGVWISAKGFKRKENNQWVDVPTIKAKFGDDGWHEVIPPNAIILYDLPNGGLPNTALLCNGLNNGTPNLIGEKFVQITTNPNKIFNLGGTDGHNGTAHGTYSASTNSTAPGWKKLHGGNIGTNRPSRERNDAATSHTHTTTSHSHSGYVYHNGRRRKLLQPTMFDDVIRKDAVFLSVVNFVEKLSPVTYGGFLVLSDKNTAYVTEADNTIFNHTHDTALSSTYSSTYSMSLDVQAGQKDGSVAFCKQPHSHLLSHKAPSSGTITFPNQDFYAGKTTGKLYWDELPYGTVCFFTDDLLPDGWQPLSEIKKYSNGAVSENVTSEGLMIYMTNNINSNTTANPKHNHTGSYTTATNTTEVVAPDSGGVDEFRFYNHTHTVPDNHSTEVDHTPSYFKLFVGYKVLPTYTITFDANGGSGTQPNATKTYGINLKLPTCTFTNSSKFKHWNTRADGNGTSYNTTDVTYNIDENMTLYAIWETTNIATGSYSPSVFKAAISEFLSKGSSRTVKNSFTAKVNNQEITVSAGSTVYYSGQTSGTQNCEFIGFGSISTNIQNVANSFTTYKTYCIESGSIPNFNNYQNYPITIGGNGITFN